MTKRMATTTTKNQSRTRRARSRTSLPPRRQNIIVAVALASRPSQVAIVSWCTSTCITQKTTACDATPAEAPDDDDPTDGQQSSPLPSDDDIGEEEGAFPVVIEYVSDSPQDLGNGLGRRSWSYAKLKLTPDLIDLALDYRYLCRLGMFNHLGRSDLGYRNTTLTRKSKAGTIPSWSKDCTMRNIRLETMRRFASYSKDEAPTAHFLHFLQTQRYPRERRRPEPVVGNRHNGPREVQTRLR
jgi:hypothetical protein